MLVVTPTSTFTTASVSIAKLVGARFLTSPDFAKSFEITLAYCLSVCIGKIKSVHWSVRSHVIVDEIVFVRLVSFCHVRCRTRNRGVRCLQTVALEDTSFHNENTQQVFALSCLALNLPE